MNPRRILFIAEGQLGDLLLLTPAIRAMKETFPSSSISVLIVERRGSGRSDHGIESASGAVQKLLHESDSVLSTSPHIDEILVVNRVAMRSLRGFARVRSEFNVVRFLRAQRFDIVISTFPEDRFAVWSLASGASVRVGQHDQGLSWLLTHRPKIKKHDRGVLEYYCELARTVGAKVTSARTEYVVPSASQVWVQNFLEQHGLDGMIRLVAVHPGATGNYKIWPPDRYAALIDFLQSETGARVVLCNGVHDRAIVDQIRSRLHTTVVEADTGTNTGNLGALLSRCSLCISNDSGPRHLAVAVGTQSLAFFRQFHEQEWGVYVESETLQILQAKTPCPACPPRVCLDKLSGGETFGCSCLRMIGLDQAKLQSAKMLAFLENK